MGMIISRRPVIATTSMGIRLKKSDAAAILTSTDLSKVFLDEMIIDYCYDGDAKRLVQKAMETRNMSEKEFFNLVELTKEEGRNLISSGDGNFFFKGKPRTSLICLLASTSKDVAVFSACIWLALNEGTYVRFSFPMTALTSEGLQGLADLLQRLGPIKALTLMNSKFARELYKVEATEVHDSIASCSQRQITVDYNTDKTGAVGCPAKFISALWMVLVTCQQLKIRTSAGATAFKRIDQAWTCKPKINENGDYVFPALSFVTQQDRSMYTELMYVDEYLATSTNTDNGSIVTVYMIKVDGITIALPSTATMTLGDYYCLGKRNPEHLLSLSSLTLLSLCFPVPSPVNGLGDDEQVVYFTMKGNDKGKKLTEWAPGQVDEKYEIVTESDGDAIQTEWKFWRDLAKETETCKFSAISMFFAVFFVTILGFDNFTFPS